MTTKHGFQLIRSERIDEISSEVDHWVHERTGAQLVSVRNKDENKVFGITFRTPVKDSTGVAHIMEHSVLCGSDKYPVKEPFVELLKGSLKTFLNAMTYPDKTVYPVASTNTQDFYNLVDVYLDAVFHPAITPLTLEQEGWHYELFDPKDDLIFKGVVFNEMKGAYSSPDQVMAEKSRTILFPNHTYSQDSGGDPVKITDLTYAQFKKFHDTYYHPSNARIWFYGDDDPDLRLKLLDEVLSGYKRIKIDSSIPLQHEITPEKLVKAAYDSGDDPNAKSMVTVNWLFPEVTDPEENLGLNILSSVLVGNPAAPLYRALMGSGLGEDLIGSALENGLRQPMYSLGLKGIHSKNAKKVEKLILETLKEQVRDGIDKGNIAATMNTVEFVLREQNTGSFPRGLMLMLTTIDDWLYDRDPIEAMKFEEILASIKARLVHGEPYFESLITKYFLTNSLRTTLLLEPDSQLGRRNDEAEKAKLANVKAKLTDAQLKKLISANKKLKAHQEAPDSPEALKTIPTLKKSDLEKKVRDIPTEVIKRGPSTILYHELDTNGIVYLELGFDIRSLPQRLVPLLPTFNRALLETGTDKQNFIELIQRIGQSTGGIHASAMSTLHPQSKDHIFMEFLRGKAMTSQSGELLNILTDVLKSAVLADPERIRQMVLERKSGLESRLTDMGHSVVNTRLRAAFNPADALDEYMGGVEQLFFIRQLEKRLDTDWDAIAADLESIRKTVLNRRGLILNITTDSASWKAIKRSVLDFPANFPSENVKPAKYTLPEIPEREGLSVPSMINFVGQGMNLYDAGYTYDGSMLVVTSYLSMAYLWDRLRVRGGAYGAMNRFDRVSGVYTLMSYRDPNLDGTLQNYAEMADYLQNLKLSKEELTKAIIGAIGDADAYQMPDAKGHTAMLWHLLGITREERQQRRDELLGTTLKDFTSLAKPLAKALRNARISVLGGPDGLKASTHGLQVKNLFE
ncbi:MAG TPA: insulinase family protein [Bellilinea sp.]|nr:insulinase family protein [Bellilinea sp.]